MRNKKFVTSLLNQGLIVGEATEALLEQSHRDSLPGLLVEKYISYEKLCEFFLSQYKIQSVELSEIKISQEAISLLPYSSALKYNAMPLQLSGDAVEMALADPLNQDTIDDLRLITRREIIVKFSAPREIDFFINKYYGADNINSITTHFIDNHQDADQPPEYLESEIQNAPAVKLIDSLIEAAVLNSASDIHIEPFETHVRVRYRLDGHLAERQRVDKSLLPFIISRLKVMGGMDIAEKRLPQDGSFKIDGLKIDFRISTIPTIYGEKAVLRLIYGNSRNLSKNSLGFSPEDMKKISALFSISHGAILITGPTGSGKTTTLSAFLQELNSESVNIVTIEDPVETTITGVNQISLAQKAGLDFAGALRSILRQDPDIIMIGEIRDGETASIAMRAAMTGHLVLSTLHTNDAAGAIVRLIEMGVPGYIVASTVRGVISQRLVRRLCTHCRRSTTISPSDAKFLNVTEDTEVYYGEGCNKCNGTGYRGRFAIYEYLIMDQETSDAVKTGASAGLIQEKAEGKGMKTMLERARESVLRGETSLSEMYKAVFDVKLLED